MKRTKKLYVLLGVFVAICALTIGISLWEEKKEKIKNSNEVILKINDSDVKSISWEYSSNALAFHKSETWIYDEDESFPVDEEKILELIAPFENLESSFIIEEASSLGQYGLQNPECTITIKTEAKTYEILLGDFSSMDSERYVSIGDGNVYLVPEDPYTAFEKTLDDFILHNEVGTFEDVTAITFDGEETIHVTYEEDTASYSEDDKYFTTVNGQKVALDSEKITAYMSAISEMSLLDYKTYHASEELETYGMDEPELVVTMERKADETFRMSVAGNYVRIGDSELIYEITEEEAEKLMAASYNDLRHDAMFTASFSDITQMEIVLEDENYTITSEKSNDTMKYYYNEEEIEYDNLSAAVAGLLATEFTDEKAAEKQEICLVLSLDNEDFPQVELEFYRYNGESCLAVVNGESVALVARENVVALIEAVNAIVL